MLNWGIYGAGVIAGKFAKDLIRVEGAKIIAAYARKEPSVIEFCERYDIDKAYFDSNAFFDDPDIDVVYVATPHALHAEIAIRALKAGKHVLCEKPFTLNAKQTEAVFAVAKAENRFVMEALWTLFLPTIHKAISWVEAGKIGKLKAIEANFGFAGEHATEGRLLNPKLGGGALLDVGIYPVLMANHLTHSVPTEVKAIAHKTDTGVDGSVFVTCTYPDGVLASLNASIEIDMVNTLVIYGDKGRIEVPSFWMADEAICIGEAGTEIFKASENETQGYHHEALAVCDAIKRGDLTHDVVSPSFTVSLSTTLDRIRKEIGLVYDAEE
jgi:predicted dehydrogenase